MQPRHRDILDPEGLKRRKPSPAFLPLQVDPLRDRAFAIAREPERVVAVRAPREELDSAGVGRVGADRIGERVGPVDGRVENVKRREPFVVFEAGIDIVAAKEQSSGGNVLYESKKSSAGFASFSGGAARKDPDSVRRSEADSHQSRAHGAKRSSHSRHLAS